MLLSYSQLETQIIGAVHAIAVIEKAAQELLSALDDIRFATAKLVAVVEPEAVEPEAVEPEAVEPEAVEPEAVEPEAVEPEAVEPEAVEPEANSLGAYAETVLGSDALAPRLRTVRFFNDAVQTFESIKHLDAGTVLASVRRLLENARRELFAAILDSEGFLSDEKWNAVRAGLDDLMTGRAEYELTVVHSASKGTHVKGADTKRHKDQIGRVGFQWRPLNGERFWRIMGTPAQTPNLVRIFNAAYALHSSGITVGIEIEDLSTEAYTEERIEYLERRAEVARDRADQAATKAQTHYEVARRVGDRIPFGQPILVGHHSESRHRRDIDRINGNMSKSVELSRKAERLESRADSRQAKADELRRRAEANASGELERCRASRQAFQKLLSTKLKKVNPMVRRCIKTAEGKGERYWSIHAITFHDDAIPSVSLWIESDKCASLSFQGSAPRQWEINLEDSEGAFEKLEAIIKSHQNMHYRPVLVENSGVWARFDLDAFRIRDRVDTINEPTTTAPSNLSRRDLLTVFAWARANETKLQNLSYSQILLAMRSETEIWGHSYCAID
jgi:hypothetical protein